MLFVGTSIIHPSTEGVFLLCNILDLLIYSYKYKMNLMTEIAAKEEFSGLDAVSELLKDKDIETNEQGRRLLEQYGYWGNKGLSLIHI